MIDPLSIGIATITFGSILIFWGRVILMLIVRFIKARNWRKVGRILGLEFSSAGVVLSLTGEIKGFEILITSKGILDDFNVLVGSQGRIPYFVSLRPPILINNQEMAAVLDHKTRTEVVPELMQLEAIVNHGRIQLSSRGIKKAPVILSRLLVLAKLLSIRPQEFPHRLADNALNDPDVSVQLANLELLQEFHPRHPKAFSASRESLKSPHPQIRVAACRFLGEEGLEVAKELTHSSIMDITIPLRAWEFVLQKAPETECVRILEKLAAHPIEDKFKLLVEGAIRLSHIQVQNLLLMKADRLSEDLAAKLADGLHRITSNEAEQSLIKLLNRESETARLAAARALGRAGSVSAVEPLLNLARSRRSTESLRLEARHAVLCIQARLAGAEAGQLSLTVTGEQSGALSITEDGTSSGTLSLAVREKPASDSFS
jgi:hypothetical protein